MGAAGTRSGVGGYFDHQPRREGASMQRICCAIGILEFTHCQPTGGNGHFSPTAGSEVCMGSFGAIENDPPPFSPTRN